MIWILFFGTMALSLWATMRVKSVYNHYNRGVVRSGVTGGQVAAEILRRSGIYDVQITHAEGMLGDHYDPLHKRLVNVVEEIALASGLPVPEIYVLEQESGINAFAAGLTPADAAITVTRGALERLERAELQGVIAH